ncbi:ribosomal protein RPS14, putative [Toxoplasma gondii ME49]|uniref:30S ribosomal protein S14, putative n=11 Tax=Toxoplasma gondii TaxID=5811 RepID=A0A125YHY6_TOXGV|nr:ribosomal protein RPS14, putative [Toxoplasma gondii ME49]EPR59466.1 putative ribosomal protein RPS14 [Toxoplasma gondii GT1]ESS30679.1 putative ribosomal protein RPS14 [Toxoplasma gondii VEG]KAF4643802.1 putative ribosomal protein RPS14 [Toxoplasma gondii]KFG40128.1 putative ribosomal protein RPS14 [Toxoplasma gondii GAB2-2007-GAL-DOM2]KFG44739.1 putative ribosomal protein RPS14 [Toxoplasma gondii p89]KFG54810.1 putative ribosomal protein RPS14 [Toxoplasma gondii FOU]KFH08434.1 putative |eukprot:XP_018637775.1 ribosomal protein RPS14, putative [Toxoplasma gondii ME49]
MRYFFCPPVVARSLTLALLFRFCFIVSLLYSNERVTFSAQTGRRTGGISQKHLVCFVDGAHLPRPSSFSSATSALPNNAADPHSERVASFMFRPSSLLLCFSTFSSRPPPTFTLWLRPLSSCHSLCNGSHYNGANSNFVSRPLPLERGTRNGSSGTCAHMLLGNAYPIRVSSNFEQVDLLQTWSNSRKEPDAYGGGRRTALAMVKQRRYQLATDNLFVGLRDAQVQRNLRRKQMMIDYKPLRQYYKYKVAHATSMDERLDWHCRLQRLPRDSSPTRYRNRCRVCGRARGYFRFFGLCRHHVLDMVRNVMFPGFTKAEW